MPITGHPPHRTGRAALSGSAAIAGFCPHRTHRAALPQWALQEGPEAPGSCWLGHFPPSSGLCRGGQRHLNVLGEGSLYLTHSDGLDAETMECSHKVRNATFSVGYPRRAPAAPERPTKPLKRPLPPYIARPSVRAVILVTIQFDRQPSIVSTLDDEIDRIAPYWDLRTDAVSAIEQAPTEVALKSKHAVRTAG
jgi:hypothetical protein